MAQFGALCYWPRWACTNQLLPCRDLNEFFLLSGMQRIDISHWERKMGLTKGDGNAKNSSDS
jgi:hypothetical protein